MSYLANSNYYYQLYLKYKKEAEDYAENIKELKAIKNSLTGDFYDEQRNVNVELEDLKEDLKKSVRHDFKFTSTASECLNQKEKTATADGNLNQVIVALENEISALETKKIMAEASRDTNYRQYEREKRAELEEATEALPI